MFLANRSGLSSAPVPTECNSFSNDSAVSISQVLLGLFWSSLTIFYLSVFIRKPQRERDHNPIIQGALDEGEHPENPYEEKEYLDKRLMGEEDEGESAKKDFSMYKTNSFVLFHLYMTLTSVYFSVLLTNWGSLQFNEGIGSVKQWKFFWIQMGSTALGTCLYIWTLVAPAVLPNREFN